MVQNLWDIEYLQPHLVEFVHITFALNSYGPESSTPYTNQVVEAWSLPLKPPKVSLLCCGGALDFWHLHGWSSWSTPSTTTRGWTTSTGGSKSIGWRIQTLYFTRCRRQMKNGGGFSTSAEGKMMVLIFFELRWRYCRNWNVWRCICITYWTRVISIAIFVHWTVDGNGWGKHQ